MIKKKLKKSKIFCRFGKNQRFFQKKAIFYSVTILIFTIFILIVALTATFKKTTHEKKIGEEQIELIKMYQEGESILFYIDQSAKYSLYNSTYPFAKNGAYFNEPICGKYSGVHGNYIFWKVITESSAQEPKEESCYPTERDLTINFASFLNNQLNKYLEIYPYTKIPRDNYDFSFEENEKGLEIIGIATQNIMLTQEKQNTTYSFKPSFKVKIPYKFITKFKEYVSKTKEIEKNITACLEKGSGKAGDDDLQACSDIENLKKEIKGIDNYQIKPINLTKDYTLLFDIEDQSFNNPYSEERLTIKYGINFLDTFSPLPTEMSSIEEKTIDGENTKFLTWYENYASDVIIYEIYYKEIVTIGGEEMPTDPPEKLIEMGNNENPLEIWLREAEKEENLILWKIDYDNTDLEKGKEYYFYIRAKDNAGNFVKDMDAEPVRLTI